MNFMPDLRFLHCFKICDMGLHTVEEWRAICNSTVMMPGGPLIFTLKFMSDLLRPSNLLIEET